MSRSLPTPETQLVLRGAFKRSQAFPGCCSIPDGYFRRVEEIEDVNVQFSVFQEENESEIPIGNSNGISRLISKDLTYLPGEAKRRW